jgi:hypothetical protein
VQHYGVQLVSLLMHISVFVGIFTFRRYIIAAHQKIEAIIQQLGYSGGFTNSRTILPMDDKPDGCGICVVLPG